MQEALLEEHARAGSSDAYVRGRAWRMPAGAGPRGGDRAPILPRAYGALKDDPWLRDGEPARLARMARLAEVGSEG